MAVTTNYNWTTPDDVDLVKDGAAAIRTLGSSADTTVKALNPGTTAGDIDYYTTSTAKARVGIGTAGQLLRVNSGATAPEWATIQTGGMTLLSTTTLTGATVTISAIDQTYNSLFGLIYGVTNATGNGYNSIRPNGSSTISRISAMEITTNGGDATRWFYHPSNATLRTDANNAWSFRIDNYTSASNYKPVSWSGVFVNSSSVNTSVFGGGGIYTNSAITSLDFVNSAGDLSTGTVLLYGVK
jgi:hypothetical protein